MKLFYRVCNPDTQQGLWYAPDGTHTGLIHTLGLTNSSLRMEPDPELVGWLSATETLDDLWKWFTPADVARLEEHGFFIHEYHVIAHRFYERFQHPVICQFTSRPTRRIPLSDLPA